MMQSYRRADLDGLRGVAIIMTIFLHYVSRGGFYTISAPEPVANLLDSFWSGVDIFFVLSGFLIGGIIMDNRKSANFFKIFYLRRALRILPVAVLTILFAYLAMPALGVGHPVDRQVPPFAYFLFINNFWTASGVRAYPPLGPMWSLAIEEQFYLIAPMLILLLCNRKWAAVLGLIVLASPWVRMFSPWLSIWDFTLYRLDGLAIGILAAILWRDQRFDNYAKANRHQLKTFTLGIVIATLLISMSPEVTERQRIAFGISLNSLAAASVILYMSFNGSSQLSQALSRGWIVTLGRWSYFLYLMHMPVLLCVGMTGITTSLQPVTALAICLVGAWASWQYLEMPLISYGKQKGYQQG